MDDDGDKRRRAERRGRDCYKDDGTDKDSESKNNGRRRKIATKDGNQDKTTTPIATNDDNHEKTTTPGGQGHDGGSVCDGGGEDVGEEGAGGEVYENSEDNHNPTTDADDYGGDGGRTAMVTAKTTTVRQQTPAITAARL